MIRSRERWAGHVVRTEEMRNVGKKSCREKALEDLSVDGRIILK
jgi:hypothetical protein